MYVPDSHLLHGLSVASAQCFGMPHAMAHYSGKGVRTNRLDDDAVCAVCGRMATNSHHVPAVGMGGRNASFTLHGHALRPALIALCGSGTTGCHGLMHSGRLKAEWVWHDDEAAERWWSGDILRGCTPHASALYIWGEWRFISSDGEIVAAHRG